MDRSVKNRFGFVLLTLLLVSFSESAWAFVSKNSQQILKVMADLQRDERFENIERIKELKQTFSQSNDGKNFAAIALAEHYLKISPRLSMQYLSAVDQSTLGESENHIFRYYMADVKLKMGDYAVAGALAQSLLKDPKAKAWRAKLMGIQMESTYKLGNYNALFGNYQRYIKKYTLNRRQESILQVVAEAFEQRGDKKRALQILEDLARNYPMSEVSHWAFIKLKEHNCQSLSHPNAYVFSKKLLIRLSRNVEVESGLRGFIQAQLQGRLRISQREVRELTDVERVQLLFRMRFYPEALQLAKETIVERQIQNNSEDHQFLLMTIGKSYMRTNEPMFAAREFSKFIELYPNTRDARKAHGYLGDAFARLGYFAEALNQYTASQAGRSRRSSGWRQFWLLYRNQKWQEALSMLDRPNYVRPKDRMYPFTNNFWRAKILQKLGRSKEAEDEFSKILSLNAHGYYAQIVASRHPNLTRKMPSTPTLVKQQDGENQLSSISQSKSQRPLFGFSLAAKLVNRQDGTEMQVESLDVIAKLAKVGLREAAELELNATSWDSFRDESNFAAISHLSLGINNYKSASSLKTRSFSALQHKPKGWWDLKNHQAAHTDEWKVYFPLAFDEIVSKVTGRVGIDKMFVLSIMRAESLYKPRARSWVGATGLMQIMPYTGVKIARAIGHDDFEVVDLKRPELNVSYGSHYLKSLVNYYNGNMFLAAAGYNAGPTAVNNWLERCKGCSTEEFVDSIPYRETRRYVKKVMTYLAFYQRIYKDKASLGPVPDLPDQLPQGVEIF